MSILVILRFCELSAYTRPQARPHQLTEKGIIQCDSLNPLHCWVSEKLRVDIKEHRHINRLALVQPLFLEAETLNLAEIRRDLGRRHAVRCDANNVLGLAVVRRCVERECRFSRQDTHFALLRREFPGQHIRCGTGEGDAQPG